MCPPVRPSHKEPLTENAPAILEIEAGINSSRLIDICKLRASTEFRLRRENSGGYGEIKPASQKFAPECEIFHTARVG